MGDVRFSNFHSTRIYVAYMRKDEACRRDCGKPWDVLGWVVLAPGETQSRANPTDNRWFCYYAEADDGTTWGGNYPAEVKVSKFQKCTCLGVSVSHGTNPWYDVGMELLDLHAWGGVNFR